MRRGFRASFVCVLVHCVSRISLFQHTPWRVVSTPHGNDGNFFICCQCCFWKNTQRRHSAVGQTSHQYREFLRLFQFRPDDRLPHLFSAHSRPVCNKTQHNHSALICNRRRRFLKSQSYLTSHHPHFCYVSRHSTGNREYYRLECHQRCFQCASGQAFVQSRRSSINIGWNRYRMRDSWPHSLVWYSLPHHRRLHLLYINGNSRYRPRQIQTFRKNLLFRHIRSQTLIQR